MAQKVYRSPRQLSTNFIKHDQDPLREMQATSSESGLP